MLCPTKESYLPTLEGGMSDNGLILLGKRLRELRAQRGMSQEKLSELCGVSSRHISEMERGESNPSFQVMTQVTAALGVSMKDLFDFTHHQDRQDALEELVDLLTHMQSDKFKIAYKVIKML